MDEILLKKKNGIYSCDLDISTNEWLDMLKSTSQDVKDMLIRFYLQPEHEASCSDIEQLFSIPASSVNGTITQFAKAVRDKLNRFVIKTDDENALNKLWCIPMGEGHDENGHFKWRLREELVEAIKKTHLTWKPFYEELAAKLVHYQSNRDKLLKIVLGLPEEYIKYLKEYKGHPITDIDPLSFFAIFNRGLTDSNRKEICAYFKENLGLQSDIPSDFDSIPIVNNQKSYFLKLEDNSGCQEIWDYFLAVMSGNSNIGNLFSSVIKQENVKWVSTIFLYWIKPEEYLPLDGNTRSYLESNGVEVFKDKDLNWNHYFALLQQIKNQFSGIPFSAISYFAWTKGKNVLQVKDNLVKALKDSDLFSPAYSPKKKEHFIWIADKSGLIGDSNCHYEFCFDGGKTGGHKADKVYVEAHFENEANAEEFNKTIDLFVTEHPEIQRFKWAKGCSDSIRLNNEGYYLYSSTLIDDILQELTALDQLIGQELRYTIKSLNANKSIMESNKPILNLLKSKKQIILQGAPGTGKTFKTAEIAVEMCDGTIPASRENLMKRYRELRDKGRIGFTTFHQSMDYEEFIEGIKPNVDEATNAITYEIEKGIFMKMCEDAVKPIIKDNPLNIGDSPTVWKVSLGGTGVNPIRTDCMKNGYIRIGWDGYGDFSDGDIDYSKYGGKNNLDAFRNKMQVGDIVFSCFSSKEIDAIGVVTGDYEYHDELKSYKRVRKVQWLVKDIKENIYELNAKTTMTLSTVYRLNAISIDKVFSLLSKYKVDSGSKVEENKAPYILIIDEINRGNISKIFGELITLLEADKRKGKVNEVSATLTYSKDTFSVPDNLYIIGTMNTADRSIGYIDYAVRRRFAFYTLPAERAIIEDYYKDDTVSNAAVFFFDSVKGLIEKYISPEFNPSDLMVGHSYFLAESKEELKNRIEYEVKPLLYEYANDGILVNLEKKNGRYSDIDAIGTQNTQAATE